MSRGGANNVRKTECNFCECFAHAWSPATKWGVVIVDANDAHLLMDYSWHMVCPKRLSVYAHSGRLDGYLHCAIIESTRRLDHINGNGLDCRRDNLREATQQENARNKRSAQSSTSAFLGVSWRNAQPKYRQKAGWVAQILVSGKNKYLGLFDLEENAALAYNFAAHEHYGEFAKFNQAARVR